MADGRCVGCGYSNPLGAFCAQCWGRVPQSIRARIRMYSAEGKDHPRHLGAARIEAAQWLADHPGERG